MKKDIRSPQSLSIVSTMVVLSMTTREGRYDGNEAKQSQCYYSLHLDVCLPQNQEITMLGSVML